MNGFHFLRPEWFWGFAVFLLLPFFLREKGGRGGLWQKLCDGALLRFQLVSGSGSRLFWPVFLITATWTLALFSLAGPAWEKLPQPAVKKGTDTVYVLDISILMTPADVKPSRMDRALFKMHDFLRKTKDGQNALILFAQDPFVAVPLTGDKNIIGNLLPSIRAGMTGGGVPDTAAALDKALELLTQAKSAGGRIIVLSGHLADNSLPEVLDAAEKIKEAGHSLSFLGIGTGHGAPLQMPDGSFLTHGGKPVLSTLSEKNMKKAAQAGGGVYQTVTLGEDDIDAMTGTVREKNAAPLFSETDETKADTWKDFGAILCIFILPFAAFGYRKGWLGLFLLTVLPIPAQAWTVSDLWTRPDRREAMAIAAGKAVQNPEVFRDSAWRGAAAYKAGDYAGAVSAFSASDDADSLYNLGNALAQTGRYPEAIEAYEKALKKNPDLIDAAVNKKYVEEQQKRNPPPRNQNKNGQQNRQKQDREKKQNQEQSGQRQNAGDQKEQQNAGDQREQQNAGDQKEQQNAGDQQEPQDAGDRQDPQNAGDQQEPQNAAGRQEQRDAEDRIEKSGRAQAMQSGDENNPEQLPSSVQKALSAQKTKEEQEKREQMQWLSVIEDDPSGLLRERIRRHNLAKRRGR